MRVPRTEWTRVLQEFTERNANKRTVLELDDRATGVREEEVDMRLCGVAYEPESDRIQIMLADPSDGVVHLTHSVPNPRNVEVLMRDRATEEALWIEERSGGTLLAIV